MAGEQQTRAQRLKALVVVGLMVPIGALHLVTGRGYYGPFAQFVNWYLIDILLPFGLYFLLVLQERHTRRLRAWPAKAIPVFALGAAVESAQCLGIHVFGSVADLWDVACYGIGSLLAAAVDTQVLARWLWFWRPAAAVAGEGD